MPTTHARRRRRDERGMTTSEYAVGTCGAAAIAAVLVALHDQIGEVLHRIFISIELEWLPIHPVLPFVAFGAA